MSYEVKTTRLQNLFIGEMFVKKCKAGNTSFTFLDNAINKLESSNSLTEEDKARLNSYKRMRRSMEIISKNTINGAGVNPNR